MLSRVAEDVYWMARYLERSGNFARMLNVRRALYAQIMGRESDWGGFLRVFGDSHTDDFSESREFLGHAVWDEACTASLRHNIGRARENARMAREIVSPEMWQILTHMYNLTANDTIRSEDDEEMAGLLEDITMDVLTVQSLMQSTILHDEAYYFMRAGTLLERVLSTIFLVLAYLDTFSAWSQEPVLVVSMLKSATGYGAFRRSYRLRLSANEALEFLIFEPAFPRSLAGASRDLQESLDALPDPGGMARLRMGRINAQIAYDNVETVLEATPERYLSALASQFHKIHEDLHVRYFQPEVQEV